VVAKAVVASAGAGRVGMAGAGETTWYITRSDIVLC